MQNKLTSLLNPHHLFPHIHTNTNTPTHKHIDKSSQRVPRPGHFEFELSSYKVEFDSVGQGSEYSKGAVDFASKSKETQRRRGVSWTEEEHKYKILIVLLF